MLKQSSKRRRTQKQIAAEKEAAVAKDLQIQAQMAQFEALQMKINMLEEQQKNGQAAANLMSQFMEAGLVKQGDDGDFVVHGSHGDRQFKPFSNN